MSKRRRSSSRSLSRSSSSRSSSYSSVVESPRARKEEHSGRLSPPKRARSSSVSSAHSESGRKSASRSPSPSKLATVIPFMRSACKPTVDVNKLGLSRWRDAVVTQLEAGDEVFDSILLEESKDALFLPPSVSPTHIRLLDSRRKENEDRCKFWQLTLMRAAIPLAVLYGQAANNALRIQDKRSAGEDVPEALNNVSFPAEDLTALLDASIRMLGGLNNIIEFARAANANNGLHHSVRFGMVKDAFAARTTKWLLAESYDFQKKEEKRRERDGARTQDNQWRKSRNQSPKSASSRNHGGIWNSNKRWEENQGSSSRLFRGQYRGGSQRFQSRGWRSRGRSSWQGR